MLLPAFERLFLSFLLRVIRGKLYIDILWFVSYAMLYVTLYLVLEPSVLGKNNRLIIPLFLSVYLIGRELDNAHKEKWKSALVEFWKHLIQAMASGVLLYILFIVFQMNNVILFSVALLFTYLSDVATFYEQYKTGWFVVDSIGTLEKTFVAVLLLVVSYFDIVYDFFLLERFSGLSLFELFFALWALTSLITFIKTITRIANLTYGIWLFVILLFIVTSFSTLLYSALGLALIVTLYTSLYIGKLKRAHLVDGIERSPGIFTPLFLIIVYFTDDFFDINTVYVITIYLMISILVLAYRIFGALKKG